jgi:hypothetical protein
MQTRFSAVLISFRIPTIMVDLLVYVPFLVFIQQLR